MLLGDRFIGDELASTVKNSEPTSEYQMVLILQHDYRQTLDGVGSPASVVW